MDEPKGGEPSPPRELDPELYPDYAAPKPAAPEPEKAVVPAAAGAGGGSRTPPPPPPPGSEEDQEEEGMLRMSFLGHLEELRNRIIKAVAGGLVAFVVCLVFAPELWRVIEAPAVAALKAIGMDPSLAALTPMEQFSVIYVKVPFMASLFLAAPWILYQLWAFISPGLYKREKKWAAPFVLITASLFVAGGLFAYFVAFRFALTFLLGIGGSMGVKPVVSIDSYFDLFFNVTVGIALVFELPVLIFLLTLLRVVSPRFLIRHSRYAILAIVIIAAIVTPTPDVFNLTLFAVPMLALYFVGVFASYLLVLKREGRRFPWKKFLPWIGLALLLIAAGAAFVITKNHLHFVQHWPFLVK